MRETSRCLRQVSAILIDPERDEAVLDIVGEQADQAALITIGVGRMRDGPAIPYGLVTVLMPAPQNQYDPNAISIRIQGPVVGYIARELAVARFLSDPMTRPGNDRWKSLPRSSCVRFGVATADDAYRKRQDRVGRHPQVPAKSLEHPCATAVRRPDTMQR